MAQVVESDWSQSVFLQHLGKARGHVVWLQQVAHLIYAYHVKVLDRISPAELLLVGFQLIFSSVIFS